MQGAGGRFAYNPMSIIMSGIAGVTPSSNTILTDVEFGFDGSSKTFPLGTGSVVFTGPEESTTAGVVLWGEVSETLKRDEAHGADGGSDVKLAE